MTPLWAKAQVWPRFTHAHVSASGRRQSRRSSMVTPFSAVLLALVVLSGVTAQAPAVPDASGLPGWTLSLPTASGQPAPENEKCPCKVSWTYYFDPPNPYLGPSVLVTGCANPNADPKGDWCEVEDTCGSSSVKELRNPDGTTVKWDYCAATAPGSPQPAAPPPSPAPSPSPEIPYTAGFNQPASPAASSPAAESAPAPVTTGYPPAAPPAASPSPVPANGTGAAATEQAPQAAPAAAPAPSGGSSAVPIAVGVAVPVALVGILALIAITKRRRISRWWHRVKPASDPQLLPIKAPGAGSADVGGRAGGSGNNGGPDDGGGVAGGAAGRRLLGLEAEEEAPQEHYRYSINMDRPGAGPSHLARGSKEVRRSTQQAPWGQQTSGSGDTKLTDTKRSGSVESPETPSLRNSERSGMMDSKSSADRAGRRSTGTYRTTTEDSLGSVGGMSTLGGAYGDYGSYGGEPLSGISGVSYPSEAEEDGGEYEESRDVHFVRVFIQIVPVGPQRRESIRLWLVPVSDQDETQDPVTRAGLRRGVSVILPSDPVNVDADLNLDYDRDLAFPLYSYIGAGAFGQVHRAILKGRLPVAVKLMTGEAAPPGVAESLIEEIQIMSRINHPNVVKCYGGCQTLPNVFIVEELMDCSLNDLIHPKHARGPVLLPLKRVLEISADTANALWYLHPSIVHRDLKPGNVLLGPSGIAKVGDFGISRIKLQSYLATKHLEAGTISYMAPECFTKEWGVGEKSDVYSLGIMMWEMVTGLRPWADFGFQMAIVYQVVQCDNRPEFPKNSECPDALRRLIKSCWRRNPRERPSAGDVLQRISLLLKQLDQQGRI